MCNHQPFFVKTEIFVLREKFKFRLSEDDLKIEVWNLWISDIYLATVLIIEINSSDFETASLQLREDTSDKSHQDLKSGSIIRTQALSQGYHYLHLKEKTAAKKTLVEILILNIYSIHCSPFPLHCSKISTDHLFLGMVVISLLITICCSRLMPGGYIGLFWVKAELPPSSLMVFF